MKTVYLFDEATGVLSGEYRAHPNPLEPGQFIEPTASTPIVPPSLGANQAAVWDGSAWSVQPDLRGQTIYSADGEKSVCEVIGPIPLGYSLVAPPPTPEDLRAIAKAERAAQVEGIKVTTQAGHTFDGDEVSQGRMVRAIVALQAAGQVTVTWVLADNSVIEASAAELTEALALAGAAQAALWVLA